MGDLIEIIKENDLFALQEFPRESISIISQYSIKNIPDNSYDFVPLPLDGINVMHIAALYGSTECFLYLHFELGFSLHSESIYGYTPLYYACCNPSPEIFDFIVRYSTADELDKTYEKDYKRVFPISLLEIVLMKSYPIIKSLENSGYSFEKLVEKHHEIYNQLLMRVVYNSHTQSVDWLLDKSKDFRYKNDTPLMVACLHEKEDLVPFLLQRDPKSVYYHDQEGRCALSIACTYSSPRVIQMICNSMETIDIPPDLQAKSAVHWICQSKSSEVAKILLAKDIDTNRLDNNGNIGPAYLVDWAGEEESLNIMKLLLEHGYRIDNHGEKRTTALGEFILGISKYYSVIDFLISKGASLNEKIVQIRGDITIKDKMIEIGKRNSKMRNLLNKWKITK